MNHYQMKTSFTINKNDKKSLLFNSKFVSPSPSQSQSSFSPPSPILQQQQQYSSQSASASTSISSNNSQSINSTNSSPLFLVRDRKPPSYEDSLRHIVSKKTHSTFFFHLLIKNLNSIKNNSNGQWSSSSSSSDLSSSLLSKKYTPYPRRRLNDSSNKRTQSASMTKQVQLSTLLPTTDNDNNPNNNINYDKTLQNIEYVRMKASNLSLPLLTALCSDHILIKSMTLLNDNNKK
jgi:hypothetical protein